jgi:hypothetical protein
MLWYWQQSLWERISSVLNKTSHKAVKREVNTKNWRAHVLPVIYVKGNLNFFLNSFSLDSFCSI